MTLSQDMRFAIRLLIKERWFTLAAVASLALGIGANTAVFTLVNAVLIRGVPLHDADRVMALGTRDRRNRDLGVSLPDFEDWRPAARSFSGMSILLPTPVNLSDEGLVPERYAGCYLSANTFQVIGHRPIIGRDFRPEEDIQGAPAVVLLSYGAWKNRYGGQADIIGRSIKISNLTATVIGVMPQGMNFPFNTDLWLPLGQILRNAPEMGRGSRGFLAIGRLADGVTPSQARSELSAIATPLSREYPATNADMTPTVTTYNDRVNGGPIRLILSALMGAVAFVLLIACANVANLLMARAARRSHEIGVRVSLGATRWRVISQLLVESVLLAVLSGLVGFGLSMGGIQLFDAATRDVGRPYWLQLTMDTRVFAFFALVCLGTGMLFGSAPAWHMSKTDVNEALNQAGRSAAGGVRTRRWTGPLIVSQLVLTLVLLAGAGLMMRSFLRMYRLDLGFDTARLVTAQMQLAARKYPTADARASFLERVEERLTSISAIEAVTTATQMPMGGGAVRQFSIDGRPVPAGEQPPAVSVISIGLRYFDTLNVSLVRGRPFGPADGLQGQEAAIVSPRFGALHFPGEDPIGRRIKLADQSGSATDSPWISIVGIAPAVRHRHPQDPSPDTVVYLPHRANPGPIRTAILMVRSPADPGALAPLIREEMRALDPDMPLFAMMTMDDVLAQTRWSFRVFGTMFVIFAVIALVLSAVGLYALTAYTVTQRTREIGLRLALGAQRTQIWWLILRPAVLQLGVGILIGLAGAVGVGRILTSVLVQTSSTDSVTLAAISVVLVAVALAACVWPARRAARLDPAVALRHE
jgi:predicted permease